MTLPLIAVVPPPDLRSLVFVLAASVGAALLSRFHRHVVLPTVVLEIALGIAIGPEVLGWASADSYLTFLSGLGLAFLFFFAGIEVVEKKVPQRALMRGSAGGASRSGWASRWALPSPPPASTGRGGCSGSR